MNIIGRNIRRLRDEKQVTQEQFARELNISFQAVSKWENGINVPDTLILPDIAHYFGISIDDLYQNEINAYQNYATRLLAIYESSHNQDDFIRADAEYKRMFAEGHETYEDIQSYGVLYEYHMNYCMDKALEMYNRIIIENNEKKDKIYYEAKNQKSLLLSRIGRGDESIDDAKQLIEENSESLENYEYLIGAYYHGMKYELAYQKFQEAVMKFPSISASLYCQGGDICRSLKDYNEAFKYWDKAIETSNQYADARYSKAFCYQELKQYENEIIAWEEIIQWLKERGYIEQLKMPKKYLLIASKNSNKN